MNRSVERMRSGGAGGPGSRVSPDDAKRVVSRAVIRLAMLELPALAAFAGLMVYLFAVDNNLGESDRTTWLIIGVAVFVAYETMLVFRVLLPALRAVREAENARG